MAEHTVYAVASGKGGVGKTATTVNLGAALAEQGYSVVLVDVDLGMANLGGYLGIGEEGRTLHEVLAGKADIEDAVYELEDGLAVMPSGISLSGFANVETSAMSQAVESLRGAFDYVLLDIGAGLSHDSVLPLALADAVILVSTPKPLALTDTAKTREITERLGGAVAGTVLTRVGSPADLDIEDAEDQLGIPVLAAIPEDEAVQVSADERRPVVGHDPDSPAGEGYRGLAEIVVEESLANAPVVPEVPDDADATDDAAGSRDEAPTADAAGADAGASTDVGGSSAPTDVAGATDAAGTGAGDVTADAGADDAADDPADDPADDSGTASAADDDGQDLVPETDKTAEEIASAIEEAAEGGSDGDSDGGALTFDSQPDTDDDEESGLRFDSSDDDDDDDGGIVLGGSDTSDDTPEPPGGTRSVENSSGSGATDAPPFAVGGSDEAGDADEADDANEAADDDDDDEDSGLLSRLFGG